jgi:hypothetical protein
MARKKVRKTSLKKKIMHEVEDVEAWVKARRKFLIKLAWVLGIIVALIILSQIYLRVRGVGV